MARKYYQGKFIPKNPNKYVGNNVPMARSSWELKFMSTCDEHPNITAWASESIKIPYQDPITGKLRTYYPDFFIQYVDKYGKIHKEIIEIKPLSQSIQEMARSQRDKEALIINTAKWKYAVQWCRENNITFRVMTEQQLFRQKR